MLHWKNDTIVVKICFKKTMYFFVKSGAHISEYRSSFTSYSKKINNSDVWISGLLLRFDDRFSEARDSRCQWHQLDHMQICTVIQTDNHTGIPTTTSFTLYLIASNIYGGDKLSHKYCLLTFILSIYYSPEDTKTRVIMGWVIIVFVRHVTGPLVIKCTKSSPIKCNKTKDIQTIIYIKHTKII